MTHGDKAKAKTGKSSQASAAKKSSPAKEASRKTVEGKSSGKGAAQSAAKGSEGAGKISIKKAGAEKGGSAAAKVSPAAAKVPPAAAGKESGAKAAKGRPEDSEPFANPAVAAAFKHAVKKYPNAFRKLTD